ncbi:MAG TPA: EAL domain-containing protein [Burkholderiaceae bacterium]|nr:EAL domain-containing protein [Burkholderiaceae bacterium]
MKPTWPQRIGRRLALGFGALVLLLLLALLQAAHQMHLASETSGRFATQDMQRLLRVQALSMQIEGVGNAFIRLLNAPRNQRVAEYTEVDAQNHRIDGNLASLDDDSADTALHAILNNLRASRARYADAFVATADEIEAGDTAAATRALHTLVNPALQDMLVHSNALLNHERQKVEQELADAQAWHERTAWAMVWLAGGLALAAAWLAWRTTCSVVNPLNTLEAGAGDIAEGQYDRRLLATGVTEVDRVAQALNTMAEAVAQREAQIKRQAYEDALTGLPNRTFLLNTQPEPDNPRNTLALLDIARLKVVNETLGFATGDSLILAAGSRTRQVFDTLADTGVIHQHPIVTRLGGGTFAAWFGVDHRQQVNTLLQALVGAFQEPVSCSGQWVDLSMVIGLADLGETGINLPVSTLVRNAEVALHAAKRSAQPHAWHSDAQEAARLGQLGLVSDLRQAVAHDELQMWLQPKFSLATGQPIGAEALVRWHHPVRGFVSPADFVPFAEQTGHIKLVTGWMLARAIETLKQWVHTHPSLSIAVNVSTRDLQDPGFADRVRHMVTSSGIDPTKLRLEITESGLMEDARQSIALLHSLTDIGLPLSIDDFGTGYSSLAYLQKMPVSELKIDRSFIDRIDTLPGTQQLVRAMVEMGHGLGLMVTAEGVETEAERATLQALGVDVMQGYLGSRPLHGAALQTWLDRHTPTAS